MTIAVHISFTGHQKKISENFNYRCFTLLAEKNPGDHFIFIFDKPFDQLIPISNITPVLLAPQIKNRLLQQYVYNFRLPMLLKKYSADIFISGNCVCSLRTKIPQYIILHDLSFLEDKNLYSRSEVRYLKNYSGRFLEKASHILLSNIHLKNRLEKTFPQVMHKTSLINIGIDEDNHLPAITACDEIRERLTGGMEYFLCCCTDASQPNALLMLKAFSLFKKWQKSDMKLVMLFLSKENLSKEIATYKYREDVQVIYDDDKTRMAVSAAYAAIYLPSIEISETEVIKHLQKNLTFIVSNNDFFKGIFKGAAFYAEMNAKDISEKMMLLYKDEYIKKEIEEHGRHVSATYFWPAAADVLWQVIQANQANNRLTLQKI